MPQRGEIHLGDACHTHEHDAPARTHYPQCIHDGGRRAYAVEHHVGPTRKAFQITVADGQAARCAPDGARYFVRLHHLSGTQTTSGRLLLGMLGCGDEVFWSVPGTQRA